VPSARSGWQSRQLLSARKCTVSYRMASNRIIVLNERVFFFDGVLVNFATS